jgi:hypothetical protein
MNSKMMLSYDALKGAREAHRTAINELLDPQKIKPNVVGAGVGVKWTNGQPTGKQSVLVLVTQKVQSGLSQRDMIPTQIADMPTDVVTVGYPFAGVGMLPATSSLPSMNGAHNSLLVAEVPTQQRAAPGFGQVVPMAAPEKLARRRRPAQGGWSVGHYQMTSGTIGTCVYDFLPEASMSPPQQGIGTPSKYYILSNSHVLANFNNGAPGDPILQPSPLDGGTDPADRIATLSRFVPLTFEPPVPRFLHQNTVDAAIAEGEFHELDRTIHWSGPVRGWTPKSQIGIGLPLKKSGRATNLTLGRIIATHVTIDVHYPGGKVARFNDQIISTRMSAGGDSGSLVVNPENDQAVGLLFAASPFVTIINQFENIRNLLQIEVWP